MEKTIKLLESMIITIPFAVILVIALLLADKIKENLKEVLFYFVGSVVLGATLSEFAIELIDSKVMLLTESGERVVTSMVTIFGFITLVYFLKHETIQKLINKKITNKTEKND